jgi:hypothetical protein
MAGRHTTCDTVGVANGATLPRGDNVETMEALDTDEVLASMLTENTGSHMLDSGGAYGRNFERNAGKTVEDFRNAPEVTFDVMDSYDYDAPRQGDGTFPKTGHQVVDYISLDIFHFLSARLDYCQELDDQLTEFGESEGHADESWFATRDAWLESIDASGPEGDGLPMVVNTCNGEDNLSQVMEYAIFDHDGDHYVALMVHGGCDYRGGYTRPRVFMLDDWYSLMDNADFEIAVSSPDGERHLSMSYRSNRFEYGQDEHGDEFYSDDEPFKFDDTPVRKDGDELVITAGPHAGWSVSFYQPTVS